MAINVAPTGLAKDLETRAKSGRPIRIAALNLRDHLRHMHALAERLLQRGVDWSASGVLEQLMPDRRGKLPPLPSPEDDTAEVQSGLPRHAHPSLLHARAGWIKPQALVHALLDHPLIECSYGVEVSSLKRTPSGQWQALGPQGQVVTQAPVACLAAGAGSMG